MKYQFGPSGNVLDNKFAYDTSQHVDDVLRICQVNVTAGDRIDQIQILWEDTKGNCTIQSQPIPEGATGGKPKPSFQIPDGEHLVKIEGTLDGKEDGLSLRVYKLRFFTENSASQWYPKTPDNPALDHYFYFQCPDGYQIIDLFGWADTELDSLGVYIEEIKT